MESLHEQVRHDQFSAKCGQGVCIGAATVGQADQEGACERHAVVSEVLPSGPNTVAVQTNRLSSDVGLAEQPAGISVISFTCKLRLSVPDSLELQWNIPSGGSWEIDFKSDCSLS